VALEALPEEATDDAKAEADAGAEPADGRAWFIVQTYSGYENKVKVDLEQRIKSMDMSQRIHQVVVPTEDEIEIRDGQRKTVSKKLFPGYVFVQMLMDDESWYVVRNTPGVTGFAGTTMDERAKPTPLPDTEVEQILKQMHSAAPRINIGFAVGETVLVTDGPFSEMIGTVDTIDLDRGRVRVMVSMFGRDTPVELDFLQVEKQ
jgi:transcription termination/antitermination protein NusG